MLWSDPFRAEADRTMTSTTEAAAADRDEPGSCTASPDATRDRPDGQPGDEPGDEPEPPEPSSGPREDGPGTADRPDVDVVGDAGDAGLDRAWLAERLTAAVARVAAPIARVTLLLVDDDRMAEMHARHRGAPARTDVLSFPAGRPGAIEVDVAANVDEAARQAAAHGHAVVREVLLYALHGVLHCAGYDDHDDDGSRAMHAEEDRILEAIGVGRTFDARPAPADRRDDDGGRSR
jgi:probable rRNA maturation factor